MANVNLTEVHLLNVPLENDYIHTLYFDTRLEQEVYFLSKKGHSDVTLSSFYNLTYQRKDGFIRIPAQYDNVLKYCNYVMYRNNAYSTRWFYAFITDIKYANDGRTDIFIETDVFQTWLFDYTVKPSFVEREHVDIDIAGLNTVPERLELGDYICNKHTKAGYSDETDLVIVVGATKDPDGNNVSGKLYNNIYSGINYYTFANNYDGAKDLQEWLSGYSEDGAAEAITCMFLAPERLTQLKDDHTTTGTNWVDIHYINYDDGLDTINSTVDITDKTLDGYTPVNKKLLTYPYRYLLVSNNAGCSVPMQYEEFKTTINNATSIVDPRFRIEGCLCPGGSIRMIPLNYKGIPRHDEEGINLGKFPCLNWTSDVYTNWLTQNGVNIGLSIAGNVASMGIGIAGALLAPATGGLSALAGISAGVSGVMGIANTLGEVYSHSLQPPQAQGNINSGDVVTASGNNDFHFYDMSIKEEYALIIDNYFSMFGYKVNRVKVPNSNHRENFWYTKTIDVNIDGAIPMNDLRKIKDCYNRGITFWKSNNFGNYSVSNLPTG